MCGAGMPRASQQRLQRGQARSSCGPQSTIENRPNPKCKEDSSKEYREMDSPTFPSIVERSLGLQRNGHKEAAGAKTQRKDGAFIHGERGEWDECVGKETGFLGTVTF
ncbi:hypothetical protein STEG23_024586 [Scotinomys teguina]